MKPSADVVAAWVRLLRAHTSALGQIETALKRAGLPPLSWYDVLLELERAKKPMRLRALQAELLLAQYNLSRLVDRLEAEGLVRRTDDPTDGRGQLVSLTAKGARLRRRMWPTYARSIHDAVGSHLSADEAHTLANLLARLTSNPGASA